MKKYVLIGFFLFLAISISMVLIRSAQAIDSQSTVGLPRIPYPTINPTEYVRRLTEVPTRRLTEAARKPTPRPSINPTEYIRKLSGTPGHKIMPTITKKPSIHPTEYVLEYIRKLSGTPERKPLASPSGMLNDKREESKKKLADEKIKICLERSQDMKKRSEYLVQSVVEIKKKFTSIITGVEKYYKEKLVPMGITLSNYDVLITDIATRESVVTPLLEKAQADVTSFSCTADDPHGQLKQLDTDVRAVLQALQEYRTGIHNFMTALMELKIVEPSVTPKPTINILPSITQVGTQ